MKGTWYWNLGFYSNPFNIKPAAFSNELVGQHLSIVLDRIADGQIQYIEAPLGSGKTTLLKQIIARFGGKRKVVYANCIKDECIRLKQLLQNATFKGKIFGTMPHDMIVLVDEVQFICKEDAQDIVYYLSDGTIRSVILFGTEYRPELLTDHLRESLKGNVVHLPYLTPGQAIELVRRRVGNLSLLPDYVVRELYARSQGNPRRLLQLCEEVCKRAVERSIRELTTADVGKLLLPSAPKRKRAVKRKKPKKQTRKKVTVTYSGYDIKNIRSYEEEWGSAKDPLDK